jgi:hypothetical protein
VAEPDERQSRSGQWRVRVLYFAISGAVAASARKPGGRQRLRSEGTLSIPEFISTENAAEIRFSFESAALATEQCAPVPVKVRHGLTTSDLRRSKYSFTIIESGRERDSVMVDTADRVPSNLRDLPHSIDNIDAIVHMLADRFRRNYRGDV